MGSSERPTKGRSEKVTADPVVDLDAPSTDTVEVPRKVALQMSLAVEAMQKLAADNMADVAKALGLAARRKPPPDHTPCAYCGIEVQIGLAHGEGCASPEARRHRTTPIPGLAED